MTSLMLVIIDPGNGTSSVQSQAIAWSNALSRKYISNSAQCWRLVQTAKVTNAPRWMFSREFHVFAISAGGLRMSNWSPGPVSLRLMTSQFKDMVTHMQNQKTVKYIFCGVWVQIFVWNFKGALWNFTQNVEPMHRKIYILRGVKNWYILELWHLKS